MSAKVAKILAFPKSKDSIKDCISYVEWLTRRFVGDEMTFMIFHQCHSTSHSARTSWFCKQWSIKHVRLIMYYSTDSNLPKFYKFFISSFVISKRRLRMKNKTRKLGMPPTPQKAKKKQQKKQKQKKIPLTKPGIHQHKQTLNTHITMWFKKLHFLFKRQVDLH